MTANQNLKSLHEAGVSIWLDTLSRQLLRSGEFADLIRNYSVTGATTNPTIFANAISRSNLYDGQLQALSEKGLRDLQELFFALALDDVREAAALLHPEYERSRGRDGFVSFECTPDLAHDTEATIGQAVDLWERLSLPNVMIKVPGTIAGVDAIERLTSAGVNVNVTLLFSVQRYEEVIDAYVRGLTARANRGLPVSDVASVASFFLSRIDSKLDGRMPAHLRGRVAIASAQVAYERYQAKFTGRGWEELERLGAHRQRPLWASTGTKNPEYPDTRYVSDLIGAGVVNTMPLQTVHAFADHGTIGASLGPDPVSAHRTLAGAEAAGVDLAAAASALEREGVSSFCDSYRRLLECIESKVGTLATR